jgi:hypothetical protein
LSPQNSLFQAILNFVTLPFPATTRDGWWLVEHPSPLPSIITSATKRNHDQNIAKTIPCGDTVYTTVIVSGARASFQAAPTTKQTTYHTVYHSFHNSKEMSAIRF